MNSRLISWEEIWQKASLSGFELAIPDRDFGSVLRDGSIWVQVCDMALFTSGVSPSESDWGLDSSLLEIGGRRVIQRDRDDRTNRLPGDGMSVGNNHSL
ncbi:hypothetical protein PAXRUDRAFT_833417, partial [Paxillus rubicundulus Ve08.2h10]